MGGASVGAGVVILTDLEVGAWAMIAAGSVVTKTVPAHALVGGFPARMVGYVCRCGHRLELKEQNARDIWTCTRDGSQYEMGENQELCEIKSGPVKHTVFSE